MQKSSVVEYFGEPGATAKIARKMGISVQAVHQWGEILPEGAAYKIESLTDGALRVDPAMYEKSMRAA